MSTLNVILDTGSHRAESSGTLYVAPLVPDYGSRITVLAFRQRFSMAEKAAIELASLDNPTAPMPERAAAAGLRAYLGDVAAAQFIDLTRPDTRAGVEQIEAMGLIAEGRAGEILDAPVQLAEAPA